MKGWAAIWPFFWGITLALHLGFLNGGAAAPKDLYLCPGREVAAIAPRISAYLASADPLRRETGKILFLLERMQTSPHVFLRNGSKYSGREAAAHLRWKYGRGRSRIKTAKQFIDHVASRSLLTGQSYLMKIPGGKAYFLRDILYNELARLG